MFLYKSIITTERESGGEAVDEILSQVISISSFTGAALAASIPWWYPCKLIDNTKSLEASTSFIFAAIIT